MLKIKSILLGSAVTLISGTLLLLLCAGVIKNLPSIETVPFATVVLLVCVAAVMIGGWSTARTAGERGWLHGAAIGMVYLLLLGVLSFLFGDDIEWNAWPLRGTAFLLCGTLGGMLGVRRKESASF